MIGANTPTVWSLSIPQSFRGVLGIRVVKRFFDIFGSCVCLVATAPLVAVIAVAVWLSSGAPIFFRHGRIGREGRRFECLKFRTMVVGAEEWLERDETLAKQHREEGFKLPLRDDPRITSIGRFLRRTQLDELPQFWNVLVGEMSLVGPRPLVLEELEWFTEEERELLLSVRPGIFGPWTAKGRDRPGYPERAQLDLSYTRRTGPARDARLLLAHLPVVLRGQGDDT